jgi:cytohesin
MEGGIVRHRGFAFFVLSFVVGIGTASASSIEFAIVTGDTAELARLLDENPELLRSKVGPDQKSLLCFAVGMDSPASARVLIEKGLDPHEQVGSGMTLLHVAAIMDSPGVVPLLVKHGVDPNAVGTGAKLAGARPLHGAAGKDHKEVATALIRNGADPNARGPEERTPLHIAAMNGSRDVAALLLDKGADPNVVDDDGLTPLYLAAAYRDESEIIEVLLRAGADPEKRTDVGSTALFEAAHQGHVEAVRALLEGGAVVGDLAKGFAELAGHPEVVEVLESYASSEEPPESD